LYETGQSGGVSAPGTDGEAHLRFFPYDEPYDHQRDAMGSIRDALDDGQDVLFEGATGTGKTLAALAPALAHARETGKTVVITTNVHQQMRQFIEEARAITRQESIRAVVFRGKSSMCHIDVGYEECQALRDTTRDLVDREDEREELEERAGELLAESREGDADAAAGRSAVLEELDAVEEELEALREEGNVCERYYHNLTGDTDAFYEWLYDDVRTPDGIYEQAHEMGFCGYELLKEGMEAVDLVVCNYHHLLDPMIREQFFRWLGRDPEDVVAVFDEAHNVESAAREHATRTCTETTLDAALDELDEVGDDPRAEAARTAIGAFRDALVETYEDALGFGGREQVGDTWEDVTIANDRGRDDLTRALLEHYSGAGRELADDVERAVELGTELDRRYEEAYKEGETTTRRESQVQTAAAFVETWIEEGAYDGQYPVVSVRRSDAGEVYGRAELYTCIPREVTRSLFEELHAGVLMSATLRPFDVASEVLGIEDPATLAYGPQFPEERRRTYAVDVPPLFASRRDDPDVQREVGETLADAIRFTPGNALVFFPSYAEAERYHARVSESVDARVHLDQPGTRADDLREAVTDSENAALFTSLWGTLTEGVSFDDGDARTVIVVGVPYPHLDDRMDAVQDAYDGAFDARDAGWRYAVEIPTVRKTRQALGRVVRSPADYGARVLLDRRYTAAGVDELGDYSVHDTFPSEERAELLDVEPGKLGVALLNFYSDLDAWDGTPPTP